MEEEYMFSETATADLYQVPMAYRSARVRTDT